MRTVRLFMLATVLLLAGIVIYAVIVKGNANVTFALPLASSVVGFNMTAGGGLALLALVLTIVGAILLLVSLALGVVDHFSALGSNQPAGPTSAPGA